MKDWYPLGIMGLFITLIAAFVFFVSQVPK